MPIVRKLTFLVGLFFCFLIYSVYSFDYDSQLENKAVIPPSQKIENNSVDNGIVNKIVDKFFAEEKELKESKPFALVLSKKDGIVIMDGTFASAEESKIISNILKINRDGIYVYDDKVVANETLLTKISILMQAFKDFFEDDAKLSVYNNEVFLAGVLKDASHQMLLESIISKSGINLIKDIKLPKPIVVKEEAISQPLPLTNNSTENIVKKVPTINELQIMINQIVSEKKIAFERRSSTITENSFSTLTQIAKLLNENEKIKIEVAGHTDSRGEKILNQQISQDRANSVRNALISLGINQDRLTAVGYGEDFPIAKDDENGLSEINRRVEFNIKAEVK